MYINTLRGSGDSNFSCSGSHCTVPPGAPRTARAGRSAPWRGPGCPLPARGPCSFPEPEVCSLQRARLLRFRWDDGQIVCTLFFND